MPDPQAGHVRGGAGDDVPDHVFVVDHVEIETEHPFGARGDGVHDDAPAFKFGESRARSVLKQRRQRAQSILPRVDAAKQRYAGNKAMLARM